MEEQALGSTRQPLARRRPFKHASRNLDHVALTRSQRRQDDRERANPVLEILAEAARRDEFLEIAVRGGDDSDVDPLRLGAADPARSLVGFVDEGSTPFNVVATYLSGTPSARRAFISSERRWYQRRMLAHVSRRSV